MAVAEKIRTLFEKVRQLKTKQAGIALEVQHGIIEMSCADIANHLATKISKCHRFDNMSITSYALL